MVAVTVHATGPLAPDEAWERYAQPALWSSWAPQISRVESSTERLAVGAAGRVYAPLGVYVSFVVDAYDEVQRQWSWTARRGPLKLHLTHGVEARGAHGSATWLRVRGPLPIVLGYLPLARLALGRLVR
jgi:hypothetical protein